MRNLSSGYWTDRAAPASFIFYIILLFLIIITNTQTNKEMTDVEKRLDAIEAKLEAPQ
jgi:hypothetical protein